jgi:hypothetical protein
MESPEDDAFNHVEMMSRVKQENVKAQMQALPKKPKFEATNTRLDRIGAESGIKEMTNELYLYGVNVREDLGKEFNYYFHLTRNDTIEEVLQLIKELRPAIMPLEGMGRGKATHEWFDILAKHIEEMKK